MKPLQAKQADLEEPFVATTNKVYCKEQSAQGNPVVRLQSLRLPAHQKGFWMLTLAALEVVRFDLLNCRDERLSNLICSIVAKVVQRSRF